MTGALSLLLFRSACIVILGIWSANAADSDSRPLDPSQPAAMMKPVERVYPAPPQPYFNVRDFKATGDGVTLDTTAFQEAIAACAGSGGTVIVPAGRYACAPLELKSNMTFYLQKGAILLGSLNPLDYPVNMPPNTSARANQRSLIYAFGVENLTIDGPGEIDGRGKELNMVGKEALRPSLLRIFSGKNITVRHVTFRNPRMWTCVYSECQNLLIDATITDAPAYIENLDGMDICDSEDVIIRNNFVRSEDDGICLKSHGSRGLKNVLIENNTVICHRANAIKLGTATHGPVEHLRILNNTVYGALYGGLCLESVDGGEVSDIIVRGLDLYHVAQPIYLRLDARGSMSNGSKSLPLPGGLKNVIIERVRALGTHKKTKPVSSLCGIANARIQEVVLRDMAIEVPGGLNHVPIEPPENLGYYPQSNEFGDTPGSVFYLRHADKIRLERVITFTQNPDVRPWLAKADADVEVIDCKQERFNATIPPIPDLPLPNGEQ